MNWMDTFIDNTLEKVPKGRCRTRMEKELRDHMLAELEALTGAGRTVDEAQAETLRLMGEPETLREEYGAAWRRSLPARLEELGRRIGSWALGCALMGSVHFLVYYAMAAVWKMSLHLRGDSPNPWERFIRGTVGEWDNSLFWRDLFPLVLALAAGAFFLSGRFRGSRHPAVLISVGLSFHWAYIVAYITFWQAIDDHHMPFWEAAARDFLYCVPYHALTLLVCILLAAVFARRSARAALPKAA